MDDLGVPPIQETPISYPIIVIFTLQPTKFPSDVYLADELPLGK